MILLYAIPEEDSRAKRLSEILAEEGLEHRYVGKEAAGQTLGALFAGETEAKTHPAEDLPEDPGIIFNAADIEHDDAAKFLDKLVDNGIVFGYQVLADDSMMSLNLGDVLIGHRDYQQFLAKLGFLQQMIDGCAALKEDRYDQDRWSTLKIAIANANDFLDAVVSDTDSQFDQIDPKDIDTHIANLQKAMKALLS